MANGQMKVFKYPKSEVTTLNMLTRSCAFSPAGDPNQAAQALRARGTPGAAAAADVLSDNPPPSHPPTYGSPSQLPTQAPPPPPTGVTPSQLPTQAPPPPPTGVTPSGLPTQAPPQPPTQPLPPLPPIRVRPTLLPPQAPPSAPPTHPPRSPPPPQTPSSPPPPPTPRFAPPTHALPSHPTVWPAVFPPTGQRPLGPGPGRDVSAFRSGGGCAFTKEDADPGRYDRPVDGVPRWDTPPLLVHAKDVRRYSHEKLVALELGTDAKGWRGRKTLEADPVSRALLKPLPGGGSMGRHGQTAPATAIASLALQDRRGRPNAAGWGSGGPGDSTGMRVPNESSVHGSGFGDGPQGSGVDFARVPNGSSVQGTGLASDWRPSVNGVCYGEREPPEVSGTKGTVMENGCANAASQGTTVQSGLRRYSAAHLLAVRSACPRVALEGLPGELQLEDTHV
jgi:hypothetical protein